MTPRHQTKNHEWSKIFVSAVALVLLILIGAASDAGAGATSAASKTKFLAIGTVGFSRTTCGGSECNPPHCECVEWDGPGQARVSGLGTIKEVNITLVINRDSCVESPSIIFGNCCPVTGILQFFKEPGPVTFNFSLSDGTVCESPDEFSYKTAFSPAPGVAGAAVRNSGTVPSVGEFMGMPVGTDNHFMFFMR